MCRLLKGLQSSSTEDEAFFKLNYKLQEHLPQMQRFNDVFWGTVFRILAIKKYPNRVNPTEFT